MCDCSLNAAWRKVLFHHSETQLTQQGTTTKTRTPWPERSTASKTSDKLLNLDKVHAEQSSCIARTAFDLEDLRTFFGSGLRVLCTDFQCVDLPAEVLEQIEHLPTQAITAVEDLDSFDRILIFTDGSSQPAMRRYQPQQADELGKSSLLEQESGDCQSTMQCTQ